MPCSKCGVGGHNKRTCVTSEPPVALKSAISADDCFVCYETVSVRGQVKTPCGHTYCIACFVQHTQINKSNNCGYCRTELEIPRKQSAGMSVIKRTEIINNCISDYEIYETIYTDFYRQMRIAIHSHPTLVDSARATNVCKEILKDISLDFGLWMIGMKVSDAVMEELI
jgi:hypothetical protein